MRFLPVLAVCLAPASTAQIRIPSPVAPASATATTFEITGTSDWLDTTLDLRAGDQLTFTATGTMTLAPGKSATPQGATRGFRDLIKAYPVNEAGQAALIGRIGSSDAAIPFLIGASKTFKSPRQGRLFLNVNKSANDAPDGTYTVTVEFTARGADPTTPTNYTLPEITQRMIDRIPRRVTDAQGNAGDNTNFLVVGNEKQVLAAFEAAGWVKVDRDKNAAIVSSILATLNKQAYLTLPMSELTLFGRVQDYGLAHAEPIQVVAQRHHLRLWKAPFLADNTEVWVGAATHDIGFDRDQRNNGVTHKIDPNIDDERQFVAQSLEETGLTAKETYFLPTTPSRAAQTATGATFHSDGRVLVIFLAPEQ